MDKTLNPIARGTDTVSLNGDWRCEAYLPDSFTFNMESGTGYRVDAVIPSFPAKVPGAVHADLRRAGIVDDPYFMDNHLKCEWVENKCYAYEREFAVSERDLARKARLMFLGLNFRARIYLNGALLGTHENIHTPARFDLTGRLKAENTLCVLIERQPEDAAQFGSTSECVWQSQRFGYGWDFCTRMIGAGIYKDVYLQFYDTALIGSVKISTDFDGVFGTAAVRFSAAAECEWTLTLSHGGKILAAKTFAARRAGSYTFKLRDPEVWWPNGYGGQALYGLSVETSVSGVLQDKKGFKIGFRRLEYVRCENSRPDSLPYTVVVNGVKIWLCGVNFLPLDHLLGELTRERYDRFFDLLSAMNCNLARLWGGGFFENGYFYDECDRRGILVWQDFPQSNGGLDGSPGLKPAFLREFLQSAEYIVRELRNRVSTAVYCGGNELRVKGSRPRAAVGFDDPNIRRVMRVVRRFDPGRVFHPTTPSGPRFDYDAGEDAVRNALNQNVHGPWQYLGPVGHYAHYNAARFHYQGEFGASGASGAGSVLKFFTAETAAKFAAPDRHWRFRNIAFWDNYPLIRQVFGEVRTLEEYAAASQLLQAEALRYAVERNRCRAFECAGCNVWTLNEPFPNPNCGNIVDYYGLPKTAYFFTANAFAPESLSLKYSKLWYGRGEALDFEVWFQNLARDADTRGKIEIFTRAGAVSEAEFACRAPRGKAVVAHAENAVADERFGGLFFVRLTLAGGFENLYAFGTGAAAPYAEMLTYRAKVEVRRQGGALAFTNGGPDPALYLNVADRDKHVSLFDRNFFSLRPGESRTIHIVSGGGDCICRDFLGGRLHISGV
ncbi:MAG: hypothetical protein LBL66_08530 [Clostridiales bacterium]|nr:hypothetical protein [Clostridiales bacterium]